MPPKSYRTSKSQAQTASSVPAAEEVLECHDERDCDCHSGEHSCDGPSRGHGGPPPSDYHTPAPRPRTPSAASPSPAASSSATRVNDSTTAAAAAAPKKRGMKSVKGFAGSSLETSASKKSKVSMDPQKLSELKKLLLEAIARTKKPNWNHRGYVHMRIADLPSHPWYMGCNLDAQRSFDGSSALCLSKVTPRPAEQQGVMAVRGMGGEIDFSADSETAPVVCEFVHKLINKDGKEIEHVGADYMPVYKIDTMWEDMMDGGAVHRCIGWSDVGDVVYGMDAFDFASLDDEQATLKGIGALEKGHIFKATLVQVDEKIKVTLRACTSKVE